LSEFRWDLKISKVIVFFIAGWKHHLTAGSHLGEIKTDGLLRILAAYHTRWLNFKGRWIVNSQCFRCLVEASTGRSSCQGIDVDGFSGFALYHACCPTPIGIANSRVIAEF
jgi:hypothetical protein